MAEERELILKLGKKITDRIPYKLGMEKLTVNDPEYWGLAGVVTDEMAEVALCMDVWKIPYGGSAWHMEPPGQMFFLSHPVL